MNRRDFLETSAAGLAFAATQAGAQPAARQPRVGLIGCGWYGKCDLLRLLQVAPVEVVSLCDVDRRMLSDAAQIVSTRQRSRPMALNLANDPSTFRQGWYAYIKPFRQTFEGSARPLLLLLNNKAPSTV